MRIETGARLGPYEIVSHLGAGAMGEVYLAEDTRLDRKIALKLLPPQFTRNEDRLRRFIQEAKAASALNHPNIITIYEIGQASKEVGGLHFMAAEFIDGNTLRQVIANGRPSLAAALDTTLQIASALTAAHEAGIVHRDIKPENVMLRRDGYVKVLDFGIAKLAQSQASEADTDATIMTTATTDPGTVMGTASYMSPEQARGQNVDARTDIFSLGIVLYEMVAGESPFRGVNALDVISAILQKEPAPLTTQAPGVPPELQRIVGKALRKNRDERYQTARDLFTDLNDLKEELSFAARQARAGQTERNDAVTVPTEAVPTAVGPAAPAPGAKATLGEIKRRTLGITLAATLFLLTAAAGAYFLFSSRHSGAIDSIAVLPFVNASGNADLEYLSDGMTETLISSLSHLPHLNVKARSSVFRYKGHETDLHQVAQELKVRAILTGRVVQRGDHLIVSLELADTRTANVLWSEQYNRQQADLVTLQGDIARDVSRTLQAKLSGADERKLAKTYTADPTAFRLYLKGRYFWNKRTQEGYHQAIDFFRQATDRDPAYALAYVGLADSHAFLRIRGQSGRDAYRTAKAIVQRAIEMDDTLGEGHATMAMLLQNADWNWAGAEQHYRRAIELSPNYATAHHWYGEFLLQLGRVEEGLARYKRALEIDPLSLVIGSDLGIAYYYARQYDHAVDQLHKTIEIDPNFFRTYFYLGRVYEQEGQYKKAIAANRQGFLLLGENPERIAKLAAALSDALAVSGERGYWQERLEIKKTNPELRSEWECDLAGIYGRLGDRDRAFASLEAAYEQRLFDLLFLEVSPEFDGLRGDPRFEDLVRRIGLTR